MAHKLSNGRWRVLIRRAGFPVYSKTFTSKADALANEAAKLTEFSGGKLYTGDMTLRQAAEAYFASARFKSKAPNTQTGELSKIKPVLKALGDFALKHLEDGQRIADYRDSRLGAPHHRRGDGEATAKKRVGPETVRLELAALSSVFDWVVERRIVARKPTVGIKRPHGKPRDRRLHPDEETGLSLIVLSKEASEKLKEAARFFLIMREVASRPGEFSRVLREDIDLDNRIMRFRKTKDKGAMRTVTFQEFALERISEQMVYGLMTWPDSPYLFTTIKRRTGKPGPYYFSYAVKRLKRVTAVELDFVAHATRHEYISSGFEHGLHHNDIKKQTGHRSIAALEMYNQSEATHPAIRARLADEARKRHRERLENLAEALGMNVDELREQAKAKAKVSTNLHVINGAGKEGAR